MKTVQLSTYTGTNFISLLNTAIMMDRKIGTKIKMFLVIGIETNMNYNNVTILHGLGAKIC